MLYTKRWHKYKKTANLKHKKSFAALFYDETIYHMPRHQNDLPPISQPNTSYKYQM